MIVRRIIFAIAALAALAAASAVAVVALAFALYALLRDILTPAGAAAAVAFAAALLAAVTAFIASRKAQPLPLVKGRRRFSTDRPPEGLIDRLVDVAKDRPFISAGVAAAAGLLAVANPALVTAVMRAFIDPSRRRP